MSDRASALKRLDEEYDNLLTAIDGLDADQLTRPWLDGWSVRDIVAHVLGWEREMTGALQRMGRGERPVPEGVDYSAADDWNAGFAADMAAIGPQTVLAKWSQTHMNFVRAAEALPDERYGEDENGRPKTANRLLEASAIGHYPTHATQIREWREREGL